MNRFSAMIRPAIALLLLAGFAPAQDAPPKDEPAAKPKAKAKSKAARRPAHVESGKVYMGRDIAEVMSYLGADWLVRPEREEEEQPEKMLDALKIQPGDTVADVGAGVGYTSARISKRVGSKGVVLATDIQPQMIKMMRENMKALKITNVKPILCTTTDTKLPDAGVDLIIMVDVYHEVAAPAPFLKALRKALKPGGRLVLVEFRAEDPDVPIKPEHKMTIEQARKEVEPQGFVFKESVETLPWQHIIIFEKTKAEAEKTPSDSKAKAAKDDDNS